VIPRAPFLYSPARRISLGFALVAFVLLFFSDISISTINPWDEMGRFFLGMVTPDFTHLDHITTALLRTLAFGFTGVAVGSISGFLLALVFHLRSVRVFCAFIRSIHELFWALIFLQFFGLHPLTGVLAICIPYAGVFAKVYSEILDETDRTPYQLLPKGSGKLVSFVYARIPDAWTHMVSYTSYRLECGLRSSAVLGFVGLPTLGFHLESAFAQGNYSDVGALLILFYLIIGTMKFWVGPRIIVAYVLAAPFFSGKWTAYHLGKCDSFFLLKISFPIHSGTPLILIRMCFYNVGTGLSSYLPPKQCRAYGIPSCLLKLRSWSQVLSHCCFSR
jgi:phosphonate transport system permease protein